MTLGDVAFEGRGGETKAPTWNCSPAASGRFLAQLPVLCRHPSSSLCGSVSPAPTPAEGRAEGMLSAPCDADKPKLVLVCHQHRSVLTRGSWWLFSTTWREVHLQVLNDK